MFEFSRPTRSTNVRTVAPLEATPPGRQDGAVNIDDTSAYQPTARTRPTRLKERVAYDRAAVHAVFDEALICHVGFVINDEPVVLPHLYGRIDDTLYLHGSSGARAFRAIKPAGVRACVTVTLVDGIVFARSAFHHSMNYRCVVAHGLAVPVVDETQKRIALDVLINASARGRAEESRRPSPQELAATSVLAFELEEVSIKTRTGPPVDEPEDLALDYWAGVLPIETMTSTPIPAPGISEPPPANVADWVQQRRAR